MRRKDFLVREREVQIEKRHARLRWQFVMLVESVRDRFALYVRKRWISSFEERQIEDAVYAFVVYFKTGEAYQIYVSLDFNIRKNEFHNSNSRLAAISMGLFLEKEIEVIFDKIHENIWFRKSGFELEHAALKCLTEYVTNPENFFITSVRKGSDREDRHGKDIVVSCNIAGNQFDIWFDIKNNKNMVLANKQKGSGAPSIHSNRFELENEPKKFIEKVTHLASVMFKKKYLKQEVLAEQLHIV